MEYILKQLTNMENELSNKPFPYRDTDKIQEDYRTEFSNLSDEEDFLTGDFNTYCMNIAGTLSYVLNGNANRIPSIQIEMLHKAFFDRFKQYKFFEDQIASYNDFFKKYKTYERTRKLLLELLL